MELAGRELVGGRDSDGVEGGGEGFRFLISVRGWRRLPLLLLCSRAQTCNLVPE